MKTSVVCVSHATGAGGKEVGRLVAERLGFRYVDEDLVSQAALRAGVDASEIADEERRKSWLKRVLDDFAAGGGEASLAMTGFGPYEAVAVATIDAGLEQALFWWSLGVSLLVAFVFAFPLNRWLISRGRGHAVIHAYHGH